MTTDQHRQEIVFNSTSSKKINQFISIPSTSTNVLISSSSLSFPLIAEKPGIRFKLIILLLALVFALLIGFLLSLILLSQVIHLPTEKFIPIVTQRSLDGKHLCEDFYGSICRKWLIDHPLSTLDFKRSWLTERSKDIREKFARILANLSEIHVRYQQEIEIEEFHDDIDDDDRFSSTRNELEQFYSLHENSHQLIKRQAEFHSTNFSHSISNMFIFYHQCLQTSKSDLLEQFQQFLLEHFSFNSSSSHLFEHMIEHPLMHLWSINQINLGTQTILHIQRQLANQEKIFVLHQIEQALLFEDYLRQHQINLCSPTSLMKTLQEYQQLILTSLTFSNVSINDDLERLMNNEQTLPIVYSSIKRSNELKDFIQIFFDKHLINESEQYIEFFNNFTYDLKIHLANIPIFRSTIAYQCQLYLKYYIAIRSFNESKFERWFDYIASSILQIILHSWPGDASYTCLYSMIVRHPQLEQITYWNRFLEYTKKQITSPIITVEIRLVDFFQLDSIFRFLFAEQFGHYCHLMIYKYGPKLLPFISVFDQEMEIRLKNLWKQTLINNAQEQSNLHLFPSHRIPNDCLTLLEYSYPFTLSSFYEEYMSNKTRQLYSVISHIRDNLMNNSTQSLLRTLPFHIQSERLKLFQDLSPPSSPIPYEIYSIEEHYLSTVWNLIEYSHEQFVEPVYEFFEINGHHTIEQGIFLQPTVAELYSNESTRLAALLLIAHELGHALCPCGMNLTEREYFADVIALRLMIDYLSNTTAMFRDDLSRFFFDYGQMECLHVNRAMIGLMNREEHFMEDHLNRVLKSNEEFQKIFHCSADQYRQSEHLKIFLPDLCTACRTNRYENK